MTKATFRRKSLFEHMVPGAKRELRQQVVDVQQGLLRAHVLDCKREA